MNPDFFMKEALKEARKASAVGEVPVGAVIERDGQIIGRGYNRMETTKDPTSHAELIAIKEAANALGGWRLTGCRMYVTMEPCAMCGGAIVLARLEKVFIGAKDPKAGACGSLMNIPQDERLNHFVEIETGILEQECQQITKDFFKTLRQKKLQQKKLQQKKRAQQPTYQEEI